MDTIYLHEIKGLFGHKLGVVSEKAAQKPCVTTSICRSTIGFPVPESAEIQNQTLKFRILLTSSKSSHDTANFAENASKFSTWEFLLLWI